MNTEGVKVNELGGGPQKHFRLKCPACNAKLEATERETYWGVTCTECGVKFIPVDRKLRVRETSESTGMKIFAAVMGALLLLIFLGAILGGGGAVLAASGLIWLGIVVVILVLLFGIYQRLGKR